MDWLKTLTDGCQLPADFLTFLERKIPDNLWTEENLSNEDPLQVSLPAR
jgi:hypothetical protein